MIRDDSLCRVIFTARDAEDLDAMRSIHEVFKDFIAQHSDYEIYQCGLLTYVDEEIKSGEDPSVALEMYLSRVTEDEPFAERLEVKYRNYINSGLFAVVEELHRAYAEIELRVDIENYPDVRVTGAQYTFYVSALGTDTEEKITSFARFVKRFCNAIGDPQVSSDGRIHTISVSSKTVITLSDEIIEAIVEAAFSAELMFIGCEVSHISRAKVKDPKNLTPANSAVKTSRSVNPLKF